MPGSTKPGLPTKPGERRMFHLANTNSRCASQSLARSHSPRRNGRESSKIRRLSGWRNILGNINQESDQNKGSAATEKWVHDWLARIAASEEKNAFADFPTADQMCDRIAGAAERFRKTVVDLCASGARPVPDSWHSRLG